MAQDEQLQNRLPEPGDIILFRSDEDILGTVGKAGEAYELDGQNRLRKIGDSALTKTDQELVQEYQKK